MSRWTCRVCGDGLADNDAVDRHAADHAGHVLFDNEVVIARGVEALANTGDREDETGFLPGGKL
jgi:hypothetical protein